MTIITQDMKQSYQQTQKTQSGRWSKQEHQRFMYAITHYGKDWKKVQAYVRTRSGSQVRSHAQKFFNKLQKTNGKHEEGQKSIHQCSQNEFDIQRQLNNEFTPSMPHQLVSFIRKHTKDQGGKVNLAALKQKLQEKNESIAQQQRTQQSLLGQNSFKTMSNILSVYQQINEQQNEEEQGFLLLLTKKYKKYFGKITTGFDQLIDINNNNSNKNSNEPPIRKRSFTLLNSQDLSDEQLQQRLQEIKKQIHIDGEKRVEKIDMREGKKKSKQLKQELLGTRNRLYSIPQTPKEQQNNSFRVIPFADISLNTVQNYDQHAK